MLNKSNKFSDVSYQNMVYNILTNTLWTTLHNIFASRIVHIVTIVTKVIPVPLISTKTHEMLCVVNSHCLMMVQIWWKLFASSETFSTFCLVGRVIGKTLVAIVNGSWWILWYVITKLNNKAQQNNAQIVWDIFMLRGVSCVVVSGMEALVHAC